MASSEAVKLEAVKVLFLAVLALFAAPSPAGATPVICIDPGHERTPDLSTEPIGPGSSTYKIKDGGGTAGRGDRRPPGREEAPQDPRPARLRGRHDADDDGVRPPATAATSRARRSATATTRRSWCGSTPTARPIARGHGASTLYPAWHKGWTGESSPKAGARRRSCRHAYVAKTGALDLGLSRRADLTGFNWANVPVVPRRGRVS